MLHPDQRIFRVRLKMARERGGVDPCQCSRVDPPWPIAVGGKRSRAKHIETRDGKPFGAREREPACAFAVAPALAGAGIEENAHRRQVGGDTRALNRILIDALTSWETKDASQSSFFGMMGALLPGGPGHGAGLPAHPDLA